MYIILDNGNAMMSSDIHQENVIVVVFWQFGVILYPAQWDFIYQQCVITWSDRTAVIIVDSLYKTDAPFESASFTTQ